MKGKQLSSYAAVLVITVFGATATMFIVDAASKTTEPPPGSVIDPFAIDADFELGHPSSIE